MRTGRILLQLIQQTFMQSLLCARCSARVARRVSYSPWEAHSLAGELAVTQSVVTL